MITPGFGLTATERVLPRLAIDFTTAALDSRITFTRSGNTATVTNSSGVIVAINADLPRFDYNPSTLACRGLLIEESRTNVLLNSLIDGTSLATQSVVVTAAARTLSFYGTGQIVLSGAHSATVTGTGAYPTRTTYTFTPSAATLTLTVTGTVQFAQLELGSFATSFIPTAASQVTRTADVATMTGTNFSDWFNASQGTITTSLVMRGLNSQNMGFAFGDGTTNNTMWLYAKSGSNNSLMSIVASGVSQASMAMSGAPAVDTQYDYAVGYKLNDFAACRNAGTVATDTSGTVPTVTSVDLGRRYDVSTAYLNGWLRYFNYYPQKLTTAEVQAFSK